MKKFIILIAFVFCSIFSFGQYYFGSGFVSNGNGKFKPGTNIVFETSGNDFHLVFDEDSIWIERPSGVWYASVSVGEAKYEYKISKLGGYLTWDDVAGEWVFKDEEYSLSTHDHSGVYEPVLAKGDLTESTSNILTITGGTGSVIGTGTSIEVQQASISTDGYLSATDWDIFNQKLDGYSEGNLIDITSDIVSIDNTYIENQDTVYRASGTIDNWDDVDMSTIYPNDGRYRTVVSNGGYIYQSNNYGDTWIQKESIRDWSGIAMSGNGQYRTAVVNNGYIYRSDNYGETWSQVGTIQDWQDIDMDKTGQYQTAIEAIGYAYRSTDYGATWAQVGSSRNNNSIGICGTGQYQLIGGLSDYIYRSTDYGATWAQATTSVSGTYFGTKLDNTGQYGVAGDYLGTGLYITSDYGDTWSVVSGISDMWRGADISDDGQKRIAAGLDNGYIYRSTDYGATWKIEGLIKQWYCISMGGDDTYIVAGTGNEYIYNAVSETEIHIMADILYSDKIACTEKLSILGSIEVGINDATFSNPITFDFSSQSFQRIDITGDITVNVENLPTGVSTLWIEQDATGRTITIGTGWGTAADGIPALSNTADAINIIQFMYDGTTTIYSIITQGN